METEKVYYQKTVAYTLGLHMYRKDPVGVVLDALNTTVAVEKDKLREFKLANKEAIIKGMIIVVDEPTIDWETENAFTDQEITELTKSYLALKNRLPRVDSLPILYRILEDAKGNERTKKTLAMIESRIEELEVPDNFSIHPDDMQGVQ